MLSKTNIVWILFIVMVVFTWWFLNESDNVDSSSYAQENAIKQSNLKDRYLRGPYIDNESRLSDYETAKTIIYPGKSSFDEDYDKAYDTTCLLYENSKTNQSKIKCTGLMFDTEDENGDMQEYDQEQRYGRYE